MNASDDNVYRDPYEDKEWVIEAPVVWGRGLSEGLQSGLDHLNARVGDDPNGIE
jgi:hypothetical protein